VTPELTKRRREILQLKANGHTDLQVADILGISRRTVISTLSRTYRTMGVSNVTQAVAVAIALGDIGMHEIIIPIPEEETT